MKNVIILNGDFEGIIEYVDENTFIYMDPPYRPLNATSNFNEYSKEPFNDDAQRRLAKFCNELNEIGAKIMKSMRMAISMVCSVQMKMMNSSMNYILIIIFQGFQLLEVLIAKEQEEVKFLKF